MTYLEKIKKAQEIIKEALSSYKNICLASSFGKDSVVLMDLVLKEKKDIDIIVVISDTEFQETYDFIDNFSNKLNINFKKYVFKNNPDKGVESCCGEEKVRVFKDALIGYDAWFSGVRSTEGITRNNFSYIENKGGLTKINPILDFTELDIWKYIALNNLETNPKYRDGYRSLSCSICSTPELNEQESERSGRWRGSKKECGECGIHTQSLR